MTRAARAIQLALRRWLAQSDLVLPSTANRPSIAIAYSGGADSSALLFGLLGILDASHLLAIHVHHGLQAAADDFAAHCQAQCDRVGVKLLLRHEQVNLTKGVSLEAQARMVRYRALQQAAQQAGIRHVALAHQRQDQIETVLLALLRGSGPRGLSAMPAHWERESVRFSRPLLSLPATLLRDFAQEHGWIEDPSNKDMRFLRNRVRQELIPLMASLAPGYQKSLLRTAQLCAQSARLEALTLDQQLASNPTVLPLQSLWQSAQPSALLRLWLSRQQVVLRFSQIEECLKQLSRLRPGQSIALGGSRWRLQLISGNLQLTQLRLDAASPSPACRLDAQTSFVWQGESSVTVSAWGGMWNFQETLGQGVAKDWLLGQSLHTRSRQGGERLQCAAGRPSRSLKNLYQEASIPTHQRRTLPLLWVNQSLLAAAGLGQNLRLPQATALQTGIVVTWQASN